ncbi:9522_t:CDS:2 [Entrophospora sp. SA101]|nr:9522_t:CDS:2 [Entrophospora sp. SA101]
MIYFILFRNVKKQASSTSLQSTKGSLITLTVPYFWFEDNNNVGVSNSNDNNLEDEPEINREVIDNVDEVNGIAGGDDIIHDNISIEVIEK